MSLSIVVWLGCVCLALAAIFFLNWYSLRRIQRATDAESLHLAERSRVLSHYTKLRDGRAYHPTRYPETTYHAERAERHSR